MQLGSLRKLEQLITNYRYLSPLQFLISSYIQSLSLCQSKSIRSIKNFLISSYIQSSSLYQSKRIKSIKMITSKSAPSLSFVPREPIVRFGVITDVQYADADDHPAWYDPSKTRYYRSSLNHVKEAFRYWTQGCSDDTSPSFALQLGDLIDGLNIRKGLDPLEALRKALEQFDPRLPVFHVVGNHELYNFGRPQLVSLLQESLSQQEMRHDPHHDDRHLYYSFRPVEGIKVIALDCFEISTIGYEKKGENYLEAADLMYKYHGHQDDVLWDEDGPLNGLERRFQAQNGGISAKQLAWLDRELTQSDKKREKVIVFGHCCLHPSSCDPTCLLWNYDQVLDSFSKHPSVITYLSGHAHNPGHSLDSTGIHYLVFHGVIESHPSSHAFSTLTLFDGNLLVEGMGTEPSLSLPLLDRYSMVNLHSNETLFECPENAIDPEPNPIVRVQV